MLSSSSSARMVEVPAMHNTQQMLKPESVDDYNHCMNGVDRSNQLLVSYPFVRKLVSGGESCSSTCWKYL